MKIHREDVMGEFDAKGRMKSPARITIVISEMDRDDYLRMDMFLEENFPKPPRGDPVYLRKLKIVGNDALHSGENPTETMKEMK